MVLVITMTKILKEKHILFGLNGNIIGAQTPKKEKYATQQPRPFVSGFLQVAQTG